MVDAPERIWARPDPSTVYMDGSSPLTTRDREFRDAVEYVRADRIEAMERQLAEARAESDRLKRGLMGAAIFTDPRKLKAAEAERDRLAADNARMRAALEQIAAIMPVSNCDSGSMARSRMKDIARNAIRAMGEKK